VWGADSALSSAGAGLCGGGFSVGSAGDSHYRCRRDSAKTGVEMEALTAVAVAGLTIYDMCKGIDRGMVIGEIRLVSKTGGSKS
jgi:hypothetical protein